MVKGVSIINGKINGSQICRRPLQLEVFKSLGTTAHERIGIGIQQSVSLGGYKSFAVPTSRKSCFDCRFSMRLSIYNLIRVSNCEESILM